MSFKTTCFNRYIVECKLIKSKVVRPDRKGFNRYIVECKFILTGLGNLSFIVLIDT